MNDVSKHTFESLCQYTQRLEVENKALKEKLGWVQVDYKSFRKRFDAIEQSRDELLKYLKNYRDGFLSVFKDIPNTEDCLVEVDTVIQKAQALMCRGRESAEKLIKKKELL